MLKWSGKSSLVKSTLGWSHEQRHGIIHGRLNAMEPPLVVGWASLVPGVCRAKKMPSLSFYMVPICAGPPDDITRSLG